MLNSRSCAISYPAVPLSGWACSSTRTSLARRQPDHVPEEKKAERRAKLMELQQPVAFDWNQRQIGRTIDVLIDAAVPEQPGLWTGRGVADAPEVDSMVYVQGRKLKPGTFK